jgi:hypothetical protein
MRGIRSMHCPSCFGYIRLGDNAITRIIETQTAFIRHTATEYQRRVAEQNAKAFFKQLTPAKKAELKKKASPLFCVGSWS